MIFARSNRLAPARAAGVLVPALLVLALAACTTAPTQTPEAARALAQSVVANPIRTDGDHKLDASRRPLEFIPFTGVMPGMQVEDIAAGGGYTTELMALAVGPTGKVFAQRESAGAALTKRLADHPQSNIVVVLRPFEDPVPPDAPKLDLITIVNNYHDIIVPSGRPREDEPAALRSAEARRTSRRRRSLGEGRHGRDAPARRCTGSTRRSSLRRCSRRASCSRPKARSCAIPPTRARHRRATRICRRTSSRCVS